LFNRRTYLADNLTLADSGTETLDINVNDPITCLWLKFQATNGGTSNKANTLAQCISSIEVIDGADVIYSLDGCEALALACYQLGHMPRQEVSEIASDVFTFTVPIMFGRFIGDKEYCFDPKKFTNPQIRIAWNLATITAVGATGFLTATLQLSAVAHVLEGIPAPAHLLMPKEIYSWTGVAAGTEYIDLPTDYPYKGMLLRGVLAYNPWHWMWDQIRINCDGGKFIAMNERGWDVINQQTMFQKRFEYRHDFFTITTDVIQTILKEHETVLGLASGAHDEVWEYVNSASGIGSTTLYQTGAVENTLTRMMASVSGFAPYGAVYIPFGRSDMPDEWFPAKAFRGVKLEVRSGVAANLMYVALVQDRTY